MVTQTAASRYGRLRDRNGWAYVFLVVGWWVILALGGPVYRAARSLAPLLWLAEEQQVPSRVIKTVEWTGSVFGLAGAYLLAMNTPFSAYAFVLYLVSNACWLWYGFKTRAWGLATMQVGFTVSSIIGISNWL